MPQPVRLPHRAVVSVHGEDAETFLQGLVTNSVSGLGIAQSKYAALLTPQGKVIADFLIHGDNDGYLLDCATPVQTDLIKRLSMFKLRAKVIVEARQDLCVLAFSGAPDPRSARAAGRVIAPLSEAPEGEDLDDYHAARIASGLAEQGIDFASGEVFPADINMDALHGVDFVKGCFVGQEVVSRMKRRGTARRRTLVVQFDGPTPSVPAALCANDFEIGTVTSVAGALGLARLRTDRLAEAEAGDERIHAGGSDCHANWPGWLPYPAVSGDPGPSSG